MNAIMLAASVNCAVWMTGIPFSQDAQSVQVAQLAAPAGRDAAAPVVAPPSPPKGSASAKERETEAEKIIRLKRTVDNDRKQLEALHAGLDDPKSDYRTFEAEFKQVEVRLETKKKEIARLKSMGKLAEVAKLEAECAPLEKWWKHAKDRFTLAIAERKTRQEQAIALKKKLQMDQAALDKLTGPAETPASAKSAPAAAATQNSLTPTAVPPVPPAKSGPATAASAPQPAAVTTPPSPAPLSGATAPAAVVAPAPVSGPESANSMAPAAGKPPSKELVKAREEVRVKEAAATEAAGKAQSVSERIDALRENIELEQQLLETARLKADAAHTRQTDFEKRLQDRRAAGAPAAELARLQQKWIDLAQLFDRARAEVRSSTDRLNDMRGELASVQEEQLLALREAEQRRKEAEQAEKKLSRLQNPFTLHNLLQWCLDHGPRLLLILAASVLFQRIVRGFSRRIVTIMARGSKRGSAVESENRAETLVGVVRNTAAALIWGGGALLALEEVGIPIVPLMGGAAVIGLAVAFGAQNLLRDYFTGFMVLLEDQYGVNDVVRIGDVAGQVEGITLRMTVLRDLEGIAHFIPHGTITRVSNLTHGFSRALFDIAVAYREDADRVIEELRSLAQNLRQDPAFGPLILEDPEMLGVDALSDSAVVIKFFLKTRPLQQWPVKRELLRRIKRRFDELHIEIPFPHRTVYHRYASDDRASEAEGSRSTRDFAA